MNKDLERRVIEEANIIVNTKITLRELARKIGYSKSTIHKDMQERLKDIDQDLYESVQEVFKEHIETRHYLGGMATRKKYKTLGINKRLW